MRASLLILSIYCFVFSYTPDVTVGSGGDFATINAVIDKIDSINTAYSESDTVYVMVQSGTVLTERTIIDSCGSSDLHWYIYAETRPDITFPDNSDTIQTGQAVHIATYDGTNAYLNNQSDVVKTSGFDFDDSCRYVTLDGFEITDIGSGWRGAIDLNKCSHVTIKYCYIHELCPDLNLCGGIAGAGGNTDSITVEYNTFWRVEEIAISAIGSNWICQYNDISHGSDFNWCDSARVGGDADGHRFFGENHIFRYNYIHDYIELDETSGAAHTDAFQSFTNTYQTENIYIYGNTIKNMRQLGIIEDVHEENTGVSWINKIYIYNNVINNVRATGIILYDCDSSIISNNTFFDNNGDVEQAFRLSTRGGLATGSNYAIVKNNIFYRCPEIPFASSSTGTVCDYNIYYPDYSGYQDDGWNANSINNVNPLFTDTLTDDFTLNSESPCIDLADSALISSLIDRDINNSIRVWENGTSDAGANLYESIVYQGVHTVYDTAFAPSGDTVYFILGVSNLGKVKGYVDYSTDLINWDVLDSFDITEGKDTIMSTVGTAHFRSRGHTYK